MKLAKLYKRTSSGKIQEWEIEIEDNAFRTISGQQGGKKITNDWIICTGKNIGKLNETSPTEQAELECKAKWDKQLTKHYFQNIEDVDNETFFKCMLAKKYDDRKGRKDFDFNGCCISAKLDGYRLIARKSGGLSRNGKILGGAFHIQSILKPIFDHFGEDLIIDGELYNHDKEYRENFNALSSLIKRDESKISEDKKEEIKEKLHYYIYDIPRISTLTEQDPYSERFETFWTFIDSEYPELKQWLKRVDYVPVESHDEIKEKFEALVNSGYEGAILRWDNVGYDNKRSNRLLKVKSFDDAEFTIMTVNIGTGNKSTVAGSLTVKDDEGRIFNSNIKGGMKLCKEILDNSENYIGEQVTIQYFGKSADEIPRFPYAIKFFRNTLE